jgi:hypothetical protein
LTQRPALDAETKSIDASHNFMPRNARPVDGEEGFESLSEPTENLHLPQSMSRAINLLAELDRLLLSFYKP